MKRLRRSGVSAALLVCVAALLMPGQATGQARDTTLEPDTQTLAPQLGTPKSLSVRGGAVASPAPLDTLWSQLRPELGGPTLTWMAVIFILVLTLQTKPLLSWHNLDGLMLTATAILLGLRVNGTLGGHPTEQTLQWWTYLLLSVVGLYWLLRGLKLLLAKTVVGRQPNISESASLVLILAGLCVAIATIGTAPLAAGSRDGLVGGICLAETGKLPYGDAVEHDARSPLLYLLHAGAVRLVPPLYEGSDEPVVMRWSNRSAWLNDTAWDAVETTAPRLVNGLLFILLFAAVAGIGHRHHSVMLGQTLVAVFCIFPGALECLVRPEIMLPTVLLAWSLAFVTVPGAGGLVSLFLLVLAGLAWPWAWLALPAMLAYFFRNGWHALGATVGLLGGIALALVGITAFVAPTLPRADGALAEAGITPNYAATYSKDGVLLIERYRTAESPEPTFKSWAWKLLLNREQARLSSAFTQPALPNGVDASSVLYRDVVPSATARATLQRDYRAVLTREPQAAQTWAALRTLLEATWKPAVRPTAPVTGVWDLWAAGAPGSAERWTTIRRISKIVVGLLALVVAFVLLRGSRPQLHQLTGGLLVVSAATLLVSQLGAATNWVWLMPTVLAALAAKSATALPPPAPAPAMELPPYDPGPAPRITVEN